MFTGIIEELGTVDRPTLRAFASSAGRVLEDMQAGASIAVSGRLPHGGRFRRRFLLSRRQPGNVAKPATWAIWAMAHPST